MYRRKTREIVNRFIDDEITYAECIRALDAEFASLTVRMAEKEHPAALRLLMSVNNKMVAEEMERRRTQTSPRHPRRAV